MNQKSYSRVLIALALIFVPVPFFSIDSASGVAPLSFYLLGTVKSGFMALGATSDLGIRGILIIGVALLAGLALIYVAVILAVFSWLNRWISSIKSPKLKRAAAIALLCLPVALTLAPVYRWDQAAPKNLWMAIRGEFRQKQGTSSMALPGNLLLNPSVENGNGQAITHWQNTGNRGFFKEGAWAFGYNRNDPSTFPDGIAALKGIADPGLSRLTQNVAVTGGQVYVAGAYFYHTNNPDNDAIAVASNSTRMSIEVKWLDAGNNPIRVDHSPPHNGESIAETWTQTRMRLTAPINAVSADYSILVQRNPEDPVWVSPGGGSIFADQLYFGDGIGLADP